MTKDLRIVWRQEAQSLVVAGEHPAQVAALLHEEDEVYVVYDQNVDWVARELVSAVPVRAGIGIETSEQRKSLESETALCRQLLEAGASRKALVVAVGGGITTDMAGFAAAIYKRGIRYANVPTTLLAQVDAAIGGKTGVNLDGYKNMLGAFHLPQFTFLCPEVLRTLPPREFRAGLAEMLKTFLIGDAAAYYAAVASLKNAKILDASPKNTSASIKSADFMDLIQKAAAIKAQIVQRDPLEGGERAKLNLGHSFGHAIEHEAQKRGDDITHGEAVAMGILLAARLSEGCGDAPHGLAGQLREDFESLGLPTDCPYPLQTLAEALHKDKKARGEKVKFVLLRAPGDVFLKEMTPEEAYDCCLPTE